MKITDSKSLGEAIRIRGKAIAEIGKAITIINLLGMDILVEKRG